MIHVYPKTLNLFKRDPNTHKLTDELARDEFGIIGKWWVTEKIDGTNIRVSLVNLSNPLDLPAALSNSGNGAKWEVLIQGRSNNAQVPGTLLEHLKETFPLTKLMSVCKNDAPYPFTLYGEGYGAGIQKGGGDYRDGVNFRLFDVCVGEKWLDFMNVCDIAKKLGIRTVPLLHRNLTLNGVIKRVKSDSLSEVAVSENFYDYNNSFRKQEGIVARTEPYLYDWDGKRIMFKLKIKDFE